jgi:aminobenzoyl-glutamate utilization protein B
VALATTIAHKGALAGAKAMAASAIDLFMDPQLVAQAKETFREEIGDTEYRPLLPPDQQPPLELNRDLMERYRPAMREHYPKEKPVFI